MVHIILLHGLGAHPITLLPLELYLNFMGYTDTYKIYYPVDKFDLNEAIEYVDMELSKIIKKKNGIIVIGQSFGGLVANNLYTKGWNIKKAIYIGSPLNGAKLLNQVEDILSTSIRDMLYIKPYGVLQNKEKEQAPPHDYHCITMGWFNTNFDGCVYVDEAVIEKEKHTHLAWADHRTIFMNPRLWHLVYTLL